MKKTTMIIAGLMMVSGTAMASKARMTALGNAKHLTDVQTVFGKPANMHDLSDLVTFEMGDSTLNGANDAEGGFLRTHGDAKLGFYLGHAAGSQLFMRGLSNAATTADVIMPENTFHVLYGAKSGDMAWGLDFHYSASDKKTTKQKQSSMGITLGAQTDMWDASLQMGLGGGAQNDFTAGAESKFTPTSGMVLAGSYMMDSMKLWAEYTTVGAKTEEAGAEVFKREDTTTEIGVVNSMKQDANNFFYGASYKMSTENDKLASSKTDSTTLPVLIGAEVDAASWLTLRASVTQNVLLGSTKTTGGESDTIANNTTTAFGAGMKFNKSAFDFTMATGNTGNFNLDTVGANASYTYNF